MRPAKSLFCILIALLFSAALSAQGRVAVFPPKALASANISELVKKSVTGTFEECLSASGSGYEVYDREHTDAVLKELGTQRDGLYNEASAIKIGGRLGVQYVCISELVKDKTFILINCKLIDVETGKANVGSEIIDGENPRDIRAACQTMMNRMLGGGAPVPRPAASPARSASVGASPAAAVGKITGKIAVVMPSIANYRGVPFKKVAQLFKIAESMINYIVYYGNGIELADGGKKGKNNYYYVIKPGVSTMPVVDYKDIDLSKICIAAEKMGADYAVISNLTYLHKGVKLEGELMDVKSGEIIVRVASETSYDTEDKTLQDAAEAIIRKLLAPQ